MVNALEWLRVWEVISMYTRRAREALQNGFVVSKKKSKI